MFALRRAILGGIVGFIVAIPTVLLLIVGSNDDVSLATVGGPVWLFLAAVLIGAVYAVLFVPRKRNPAENVATGMVLAIILWFIWALSLQPVLFSDGQLWQASRALLAVPKLLLYLVLGFGIGLIYGTVYEFLKRLLRLWPEPAGPTTIRHRVVVLGGGYAGVAAAQTLEQELADHPDIGIYLVSETNYLIHTPMLSEVSASAVNAQNISPTLRSFFERVQVIQGNVAAIDVEDKVIRFAADSRSAHQAIHFDHMVFAVGSVPNFFGNKEIEREAFTFKSLDDAVLIRNQIIDMFERADLEADAARRRQMLTFVVAGGGFAGVELLGGINDFARGICAYFPNINPHEVRTVLVHSRERILPELSETLGEFARQKLAERGVEFQLGVRVTGARRGGVVIGDNIIPADTFIWTAGNRPSPILGTLGLDLNKRGQLIANSHLQVEGSTYLWAAGDCAQIPDLTTGNDAPPTAQHALREGKVVGYNVAASLKGHPTKAFRFKALGSLAALGHQLAVAEIFGLRFSGFLAWLMWRGIYLSKLPTLQKQVRVLLDWVLDLFFPPDIVQTVHFNRPDRVRERHAHEMNQTIVDPNSGGGGE